MMVLQFNCPICFTLASSSCSEIDVSMLFRAQLFALVLFSFEIVTATWLRNRVYGVTDVSIMAPVLDKHEAGKQAMRNLLRYYENLRVNMSQSRSPFEDQDTPSINTFLEFYGWPKLSDDVQRVYELDEPVSSGADIDKERETYRARREIYLAAEKSVFRDIKTYSEAYQATGSNVHASTKLRWQTYLHNSLINFETADKVHTCEIRPRVGFRINGTWCIPSALTNADRGLFKSERERLYFAEYLTIDDQDVVRACPFHMNVGFNANTSQYWEGSAPVPADPNATITVKGILSVWGGRPSSFQFGTKQVYQNLALIAALEKSKAQTQQSHDSRTPSNIAILAFPILLAALPLALFADVSNRLTVYYTIFTDILTVMPLLIKGIELLNFGVRSEFATRTLVRGKFEKEGTVIAETWGVQCKTDTALVWFGVAFIVVAILAMVLGIFLELFARERLQRKKRYARLMSRAAGIDYFRHSAPKCDECNCGDKIIEVVPQGGLIQMRTVQRANR